MRERKSLKIMFKITVFLAALSLCAPTKGKIIYVDAGAVGANNGSGSSDPDGDELPYIWIWAKITSPVKYGIWIPAPSTLLRTGFAGMTIGGASPTLQSWIPAPSTPSIKFPPSPRLRRAGRAGEGD